MKSPAVDFSRLNALVGAKSVLLTLKDKTSNPVVLYGSRAPLPPGLYCLIVSPTFFDF